MTPPRPRREPRPLTTPRLAALAAILAATIAAGGCASTRESEEAPGAERLVVQVENNLSPPISLTVYLRPETGVQRVLGHITPTRTSTLTTRPVPSGRYVLVGRTTGGNEIYSTPFTLRQRGALVSWDLRSRVAVVSDFDQ